MTPAQIEEKILQARISLLIKKPFYGTLATRLEPKNASNWIKTAGTDGRHFYYNIEFFAKLSKAEIEFVVAHELMHCVYDHMYRRGGRDARLWNCAGDFVINWELRDQKVGKFPDCIKVLYSDKFAEMAVEEVYEKLLEDKKNGNIDSDMDSFDTHMEPESQGKPNTGQGDEQDGQGGVPVDPTGLDGPIPMNEDDREVLRDEMRAAVLQSAQATGAGNLPSGVRRLIKDITEPQMDWREILTCSIQSTIKNDFTFMRPNRKGWGMGYVLPGMEPDEELHVDIAIDTSGSISEQQLRDFLSEVYGIMTQYSEFRVRIWTFDTRVYNMQTFTPYNIEEMLDYNPQGGGGTDFMVNWHYMKGEEIEPHRFIMMTDGYPCGEWGDPDYCETIFLIHGDPGRNIVAPFGTTIWYEEDVNSRKAA